MTDFQSKVLLFQRESQILTARQGTCPARRVLPGTRKTPEASCFGTIHWLVWASEILDAHGRGRSEKAAPTLLAAPFLRRHQNFSHRSTAGHKILPLQSSLWRNPGPFPPQDTPRGRPAETFLPFHDFLGTGKPPKRAAGLDRLDRNMPATRSMAMMATRPLPLEQSPVISFRH